MKVLFTFGGIPHYLSELLNKLQQKGVNVTVVVPQKKNSIIGAGVKMVNNGKYKRIETTERKSWWGKAYYPQLAEIIKTEHPDIVILGWPYFLQYYFQRKLRKAIKHSNSKLMIREIPFQTPPYGEIISYFKTHPVHNEGMQLQSKGLAFYIKQYFTSHIRKYIYSRMDGTLNYSTAAYDILPSYGISKEMIHVTFNATDTESLLKEKENVLASKPILPPCNNRILHIGRLVKWKRVDLLIDAMPHILQKHPDAELVVVGNGPELNNLKEQADQLGISSSVRFAGAIYKPEELGAYMNESTIYVLAGMGGLSINDAMTYGMPIICSVCDTTERDLVRDGENGFFFEEGNVNSLIKKINTLLDSPHLISNMGKESQRIILEEINIETVSENFINAFKKVLN